MFGSRRRTGRVAFDAVSGRVMLDNMRVPDRRPGGLDVVCIGESMAMITPVGAVPLSARPTLTLDVGGAESNVACGLASLGHQTAWLSRVGADPFGEHVLRSVAERGVDVSAVEVDPGRRTGVYFKDPRPPAGGAAPCPGSSGRNFQRQGTTVYYYRAGSAASVMGPQIADRPAVSESRIVHMSGITPALSESCAALVDDLVARPRAGRPLISFDVNFRPGLWSAATAAPVLHRLASAADVVFVGRDEAETLWEAATPVAIRTLFKAVPLLVVKDSDRSATSFDDGPMAVVPARKVEVVEPVGAGDAFAAGYLAALLEGRDPRARLRMGHLMAAEALRSTIDVPPPPDRSAIERHLAADEVTWAAG